MKGRIICLKAGFYTVFDGVSSFLCRARGVFRKQGTRPLVGDFVEFDVDRNNEGIVHKILSRKNTLYRPEVANVDRIVLVFSIKSPSVNLFLIDYLLLQASLLEIDPIICFTKTDLAKSSDVEMLGDIYTKARYKIFFLSNKYKDSIDGFKSNIEKGLYVFCGPSGVGKSTLISTLTGKSTKQGEISKKTNTGKHTTRHSELIGCEDGLFLCDTPGFSVLDYKIKKDSLKEYIPEFKDVEPCKYSNCMHYKEQDCNIKKHVEQGKIAQSRYFSYIKLISSKNHQMFDYES